MEIKFKKLDPRAVAPVKAHSTDAGFDLTCTRITSELNECGQVILVYHTDLAFEIPNGYFGLLVPRSSIAKKSITLTNCVGTIDAGYRGEVTAKFRSTTDVVPSLYKDGERFCQLLILPVPDVQMVESDNLNESDRGEGGYGSTGDKSINEYSASTGSAGYPEQKSKLTNQETATGDSGEARMNTTDTEVSSESGLEQAQ